VFDGLIIWVLGAAWELALFAGCIFLLLGFDDLAVDAMWLAGTGRAPPQPLQKAADIDPAPLALFVPAWREGAVVGPMLERVAACWDDARLRIYVGTYANDIATLVAASSAAAVDPRVRVVINDRVGPSTKGDNLNQLWRALSQDRASGAFAPVAVVLHDAEDVVDAQELCAYRNALAQADVVQLPVVPLLHPLGKLVSGHYCDEFAEAHCRGVPLRAAVGAGLPLAGVGCAIRLTSLDAIADGMGPFAADSLVEDYELGLRLSAAGARMRFARYAGGDGALVATRAYFPHVYDQAVRQKARWVEGIALGGWDRLGWRVAGGTPSAAQLAARWMLWRDRRALLAAAAIVAAYSAGALIIAAELAAPGARDLLWAGQPLATLLFAGNAVLLLWRLLTRMWCTGRCYGWSQAPVAALRSVVSNLVLVHSSVRALLRYRPLARGQAPRWDKTAHEFPAQFAAPAARMERHR
jgi:bacteriophage N4 adsorption protein B